MRLRRRKKHKPKKHHIVFAVKYGDDFSKIRWYDHSKTVPMEKLMGNLI